MSMSIFKFIDVKRHLNCQGKTTSELSYYSSLRGAKRRSNLNVIYEIAELLKSLAMTVILMLDVSNIWTIEMSQNYDNLDVVLHQKAQAKFDYKMYNAGYGID